MPRKTPADLRSARWFAPDDLRGFGHRSRLMQMGYAKEDWAGKPCIAIINTWSGINPCHAHFRERAEDVKRGVLQAGGVQDQQPGVEIERLDDLHPLHLAHRQAGDAAVDIDVEMQPRAECGDLAPRRREVEARVEKIQVPSLRPQLAALALVDIPAQHQGVGGHRERQALRSGQRAVTQSGSSQWADCEQRYPARQHQCRAVRPACHSSPHKPKHRRRTGWHCLPSRCRRAMPSADMRSVMLRARQC